MPSNVRWLSCLKGKKIVYWADVSMSIVLQMTAGPRTGSRRVLQQGQRLLVGAGNWSDFPAGDSQMSAAQFIVRCLPSGAWIENLSSSHGIRINGLVVKSRKLSDGDIVSAGTCEYIIRIRTEKTLHRMKIPLVGTAEFSHQFRRSVSDSRRLSSSVSECARLIHPQLWSESVRLRNQGVGIPPLKLLKAVSQFRSAAMIIDSVVLPKLKSTTVSIAPSQLFPLSSHANQSGQLVIVDGLPIADLHSALAFLWEKSDVLFFVPIDHTQRYRHRFAESSLWKDRTIGQISKLLVDGSFALREGTFRYLDCVIVPRENGWVLLSRPAAMAQQSQNSA